MMLKGMLALELLCDRLQAFVIFGVILVMFGGEEVCLKYYAHEQTQVNRIM
jgi:hypothetical protein